MTDKTVEGVKEEVKGLYIRVAFCVFFFIFWQQNLLWDAFGILFLIFHTDLTKNLLIY